MLARFFVVGGAQRFELRHSLEVPGAPRRPLHCDESVEIETLAGKAEHFHVDRVVDELLPSSSARDLPEQIESPDPGRKGEIEAVPDRRRIEPEGKSRWRAAKRGIEGSEGGRQSVDVLGRSAIDDIHVARETSQPCMVAATPPTRMNSTPFSTRAPRSERNSTTASGLLTGSLQFLGESLQLLETEKALGGRAPEVFPQQRQVEIAPVVLDHAIEAASFAMIHLAIVTLRINGTLAEGRGEARRTVRLSSPEDRLTGV